jgi:hypothetical protein
MIDLSAEEVAKASVDILLVSLCTELKLALDRDGKYQLIRCENALMIARELKRRLYVGRAVGITPGRGWEVTHE